MFFHEIEYNKAPETFTTLRYHPFRRNLRAYILPNNSQSLFNMALVEPDTLTLDTATHQLDNGGRTINHAGTTDGIYAATDGTYGVHDTDRFTWAYWVKMANDNNCYIGGRGIPTVAGYQYLFQWYANDFYFSTGSTGSDYDYLVSGFTLRSNEYQLLIGTYDGADLHMYVSDSTGFQDLGTSNIGSISIHNPAGSRLVLGGRYGGSNDIVYGCNCSTKGAFLWDRALSPIEVRQFCRNPYQLIQPIRLPIPYEPPASGLSIPIAAYHHNHNVGSNL